MRGMLVKITQQPRSLSDAAFCHRDHVLEIFGGSRCHILWGWLGCGQGEKENEARSYSRPGKRRVAAVASSPQQAGVGLLLSLH